MWGRVKTWQKIVIVCCASFIFSITSTVYCSHRKAWSKRVMVAYGQDWKPQPQHFTFYWNTCKFSDCRIEDMLTYSLGVAWDKAFYSYTLDKAQESFLKKKSHRKERKYACFVLWLLIFFLVLKMIHWTFQKDEAHTVTCGRWVGDDLLLA